MSDDIILQLSDVTLLDDLAREKLLNNISFTVYRGDRLAITGPSGAGKTMLLRLINRLQEPTSGTIKYQNQSLPQLPSIQFRRQVVLVPQEPKLLGMTVANTLAYPLQLQQLAKTEIAKRLEQWRSHLSIPDEWLERNELQLSLGQRQIVSIARGLVMQPQLLLLDEPTSALDSDRANCLMNRLIELSETIQTTIIMVNHQQNMIQKFARQVLYLRQGKLDNNEA